LRSGNERALRIYPYFKVRENQESRERFWNNSLAVARGVPANYVKSITF